MLTNSRDIMRRLQDDGWVLDRVNHVFKNPKSGAIIVLPHPRKDLGFGLVRAIL
jgi:predicted RNA binding protein YcfA (HicA-like mRNA interferase family)